MKLARLLVIVLIVAGAFPALGAPPGEEMPEPLPPRFDSDFCLIMATHVIVASPIDPDTGEVEVVKSWKGDLAKGDRITLPDLVPLLTEKNRAIDVDFHERPTGARLSVSGKRVALYLKKRNLAGDAKWVGAQDELVFSLAWIEDDGVYGFAVSWKRGPALLVPVAKSEAQLEERPKHIIAEKEALAKALAIEDLDERIRALDKLAASDVPEVYGVAQQELWKAKKTAFAKRNRELVASSRALLADESKSSQHAEAIETLGHAGSRAVVPDLTRIVEKESAWWKEKGAALEKTWLRKDGEPERHYRIGLALMKALAPLESHACEKAVAAFRDAFLAVPREGLDGLELDLAADRVLQDLAKNPGGDRSLPEPEPVGKLFNTR